MAGPGISGQVIVPPGRESACSMYDFHPGPRYTFRPTTFSGSVREAYLPITPPCYERRAKKFPPRQCCASKAMDRRTRAAARAARNRIPRSSGRTDYLLWTRLQWLRMGGVSQCGGLLVRAGARNPDETVADAKRHFSETARAPSKGLAAEFHFRQLPAPRTGAHEDEASFFLGRVHTAKRDSVPAAVCRLQFDRRIFCRGNLGDRT